MKKLLSLVMAAAMLCALSLPAAAESAGTDKRLEAVTQKVKETLALDTEAYTQFSGELQENPLSPVWSLSWSGEEENLNISAGEDGRIIRYSLTDNAYTPYYNEDLQDMTFHEGSRDTAKKAAQAFLDKVLDKSLETVELKEEDGPEEMGRSSYSFSGAILLNGVESPLWVSVEVRLSDNAVVRFRRDDLKSRYIGAVPSGTAQVSAQTAQKSLGEQLSLRLEYVLGEDGKTASLRYLPNSVDSYYVDAHTGKLVNLTKLREDLYRSGDGEEMSASAADMASGKAELTQAERSGVEKLAGVLSKEALDQKLRAMPELGLKDYTLAQAGYYLEQAQDQESETPPVWVRLTYGRQDENQNVWRKSITVDGRTAELESLWSSIPWEEKASRPVGEASAREKAEAFLRAYYGEDFPQYDLYVREDAPQNDGAEEKPDQWQFTYALKENGYFFPADVYQLAVSARDGSVTGFQREEPEEEVTFESAEGLVSADAALQTWQANYAAGLSYLAVPEEIDLSQPEYQPLAALGQKWFYALKLGWQLAPEKSASGVDAKTGELIVSQQEKPGDSTYSDLEGSWAKEQILQLNAYGIGYDGGLFGPGEKLRQKDMVALLLSVWGYRYDPAQLEGDQADSLYENAYWRGLLTKEQRDDDRLLTRGETVKLLLDSAGYGPAAGLQGIYQCAYTDEASIPGALYGYAALAQGLGVVRSDGVFAAGRTATRAEAAAMLYNLFSR